MIYVGAEAHHRFVYDSHLLDHPFRIGSSSILPHSTPGASISVESRINRAPREIFEFIFDLYVPYPIHDTYCDYPGPLRAPLLLSSVSREWRAIALTLSTIWTRSNLRHAHPELVKLFTDRAGSRPQLHFCSHSDDGGIYDHLRRVIVNLDKFRVLSLNLTHNPYVEDDDDSENGGPSSGSEDLEFENRGSTWDADLFEPPSINAEELRMFRCIISGPNAVVNKDKVEWGISVINLARQLRFLDLSVPQLYSGLSSVSWNRLEHISIRTSLGFTVSNILTILSAVPTLLDFTTKLMSSQQAVLSVPHTFNIPSLNLPRLRWIRLEGMHVLGALRFLYSCISDAPHLDHLIITSSFSWGHSDFLSLLDLVPCPISALVVELRSITEWMLRQYLGHRNVEPSLRCLSLVMDNYNVPSLTDSFLSALRFTPQRIFLRNLEDLRLMDCLQTTDGQLADMVESRIISSGGTSTDEIPSFRSLTVRTMAPLYPTEGPHRHFQDWSRLDAIHKTHLHVFGAFQWQVRDSHSGGVSLASSDTDTDSVPLPLHDAFPFE